MASINRGYFSIRSRPFSIASTDTLVHPNNPRENQLDYQVLTSTLFLSIPLHQHPSKATILCKLTKGDMVLDIRRLLLWFRVIPCSVLYFLA